MWLMAQMKAYTRVCQMPIFLKMIAPTSFSHDIYPKEYENAKKVEKS